MKKFISILLTLLLLAGTCSGCSSNTPSKTPTDSGKLQVVATLFPQYDFARAIAGDKAEITLLLPPGMESHSYEPTPGDIINIHHCDVFLYTGDEMEPWVADIVADVDQTPSNIEETPVIANLSSGIELCKEEHDHDHEEEDSKIEDHIHEDEDHENEDHIHETENHDHEAEEHTHGEAEHEMEEAPIQEALISHDDHSHEYNPHIWTSPVLAMKMVENVIQAFVEADPANASYYEANGAAYLAQLNDLDARFRNIVEHADFDTVYVGSKFSLLYFMEEYGLHYVAAYDSCEEEAEPSIKRVVSMIKEMKDSGVTAVYYQELIEPYIANTIAEATGGETYLFHSCHNVSKDDLAAGVTYLSLMEQNALNLEKGLNK